MPCEAVIGKAAVYTNDWDTRKAKGAMQGFGVRVSPLQAGTPAFKDAILEVLSNPRFTSAAQAMSVKIRARKNTPVQEAAGEDSARTLVPDTVVACLFLLHTTPGIVLHIGACYNIGEKLQTRHETHAVLSMIKSMPKELFCREIRFPGSCPVHEDVQRFT